MHELVRDLRMARRALGRSPGFTAAAVLTLALGVGASTAIFSVVDAALLRALPFASPGRVAFVSGAANPERDIRAASFLEVRDWVARARAFDGMSLYCRTGGVAAAWAEEAEQVATEIVSPSYFTLLGARPERGRTFLPSEDQVLDRDAVAVISRRNVWARIRSRNRSRSADGNAFLDDPASAVVFGRKGRPRRGPRDAARRAA